MNNRQSVDYAYLGSGLGVTRSHRGHRMFVSTNDLGLSPQIILDGVWEEAVGASILALLKEGDRVIEVGCNVGYHSLAMCERIGSAGMFYGFEANPEAYRLLKLNLEQNGFSDFTITHNAAVLDRQGVAQFGYDPACLGEGAIIQEENGNLPKVIIEVPTLRLDDVLSGIGDVALLRLGAGGVEPRILQGAQELIARSPNLRIVSVWNPTLPPDEAGACVEALRQQEFRIWRIDGSAAFTPIATSDVPGLGRCQVVFSRSELEPENVETITAPITTSGHKESSSDMTPSSLLPPKRDDMVCKLCGSPSSVKFGLPYNKKTGHPIPDEPDDSWYYQCDNCNFLFSDVIDYHSGHAEIYDDTYWEHQDPDWYGRVTETFRLVALANELLNIRLDQAEILDFGCGIGGFIEVGRRSLGLNVWGTDIIPPKVGKDYYLSDVSDRKFDIIISCEVIEHLTDPRAIFNKIKSHLKPKGVFAFQTAQWDPQACDRDWWYLGPHNGHISLYSREGLTHVFNDMEGVERRLWNDYPGLQAWLFHAPDAHEG